MTDGVVQMDARQDEARRQLLDRLRNIRGHIAGIEKMLAEEKACTDVLVQMAAVRNAMAKAERAYLESYAMECIDHSLASGQDIKAEMQRILSIILGRIS